MMFILHGEQGEFLLSKAQEIEACNREKVKFHGYLGFPPKKNPNRSLV